MCHRSRLCCAGLSCFPAICAAGCLRAHLAGLALGSTLGESSPFVGLGGLSPLLMCVCFCTLLRPCDPGTSPTGWARALSRAPPRCTLSAWPCARASEAGVQAGSCCSTCCGTPGGAAADSCPCTCEPPTPWPSRCTCPSRLALQTMGASVPCGVKCYNQPRQHVCVHVPVRMLEVQRFFGACCALSGTSPWAL